MYRKLFFLSLQSWILSLGYICEKITKKFFESFNIYPREKILKNSIGSNEYIIKWEYDRLQYFVHIRFGKGACQFL